MKHITYKPAFAALFFTIGMTGCGANVQTNDLAAEIVPQTVSGTEADAEFLAAQNAFSLTLIQQTAAEKSGENLLISPYSVMQALAMTANGAEGNTLAEMEQTLGGIPAETLNQYLYYQRTNLPDTENSRLKTANSLWFRDDEQCIQVLPEFLQTTADYYAANAFRAAFDKRTVSDINNWCSEHTDGMIPMLLTEIPDEVMMYLINAVCFDAKWQQPYENEPYPHDFYAVNGITQTAQMMASDESVYLEDVHATGFLKYYKGGDYAFAALLPEEGMRAEEYLAQLTPQTLQSVLLNIQNCEVRAVLPQFSYDFEIEYHNILANMGMPSAFDEGADFSRMAKTDLALYISRVLHKTHIDVDTEGTKAAAVTAVEMVEETAAERPDEPKYVILNRPFLYLIVDTKTMLPIFMGVLNEIP